MKKFGRAKTILLTTCLSVLASACASLPPFPEVWQCQYNGNPRAFFCVNSVTKKHLKIPVSAPSMKAAQCVSADDFKNVQNWIAAVEQIAHDHCH